MTTTTVDLTRSVRQGLARLLKWLTHHPGIPLASVGYVDNVDAELELPPGGLDTLTAVADAADALHAAKIEVADFASRRVTELTVHGTIPGDGPGRPGLAVQAVATVFDHGRARLLASLGVPPDPRVRAWDVTVEHLRGLAERAGALS
jgi:hypothetical protein